MGILNVLPIGFGNSVMAHRIITIVSPDASPIKRLIADARSSNTLIDATAGRRTRSVIVLDNHSIVLSSVVTETLASRLATSTSTFLQTKIEHKAAEHE